MEKANTKENYEIKEYIEEALGKVALEFREIDFGDDDLNYRIDFDASDLVSGMGELGAYIYFTTKKPYKCTLLLGNIYKFRAENENKSLEIANSINKKLNSGRIIVVENPKQLIFLDGRNLEELDQVDSELIDSMLFSAKVAIAILYTEIEGMTNEK